MMSSELMVDTRLRGMISVLVDREECGVEQARAEEIFARLVWSRLTEPGDGVAGRLIDQFGAVPAIALLLEQRSPAEVCRLLHSAGAQISARTVGAALERWRLRLDRHAVLDDVERACARGLRVVVPGDEEWPLGLHDLGVHAPRLLWVRGDRRVLQTAALAVVGARAATDYGAHATAEIVDGVSRAGVTVISGAAYGIDAVAHRSALAAGGTTVAVLAGGADRPYPAAHDALIDRIAREGLVCAEMPPGSAPTKWRFRMRNRLIAAATQATLVTEAGMRSGTINTAGHASELGRALGALPGPITSAASAGCHHLIREYGAVLVTNTAEACELLGIDDRLPGLADDANGQNGRIPSRHERLLDAFPLRGMRELHDLARTAGLSVGETESALGELELLAFVQRHEHPTSGAPMWSLVRAPTRE